jgi:endoglucanase
MDSQFNEVALDYNAGITASFALLTAKGLSAGESIPDGQFPPKDVRNLSSDLLKTDREFFVSAKQLASNETGVEIEATVDNRSRWPAKVTDQLSFRYYFTLDRGTTAADVKVSLSGDDKAKAAPAKLVGNNVAYVEVGWPGEKIHPGSHDTHSRTVKLKLTAPQWDAANDWSHKNVTAALQLLPRIPVYEAGALVGGEEPKL